MLFFFLFMIYACVLMGSYTVLMGSDVVCLTYMDVNHNVILPQLFCLTNCIVFCQRFKSTWFGCIFLMSLHLSAFVWLFVCTCVLWVSELFVFVARSVDNCALSLFACTTNQNGRTWLTILPHLAATMHETVLRQSFRSPLQMSISAV